MTGPAIGPSWPGSAALVTDTRTPSLDLAASVGQVTYTFRFSLIDAVSGDVMGDIHPIRSAALSHNTASTIKRSLSFPLGKVDTAAVNPITDRILVFADMPAFRCPDTVSGEWPLGRYMWSDPSRQLSTAGRTSSNMLSDEMLRIDQQLEAGLSGTGRSVPLVIIAAMAGIDVDLEMEPSPFMSADAWGMGVGRGQVLEALSVAGDYWSPWLNNQGRLQFLRTFNPADRLPDIDLDSGYQVIRNSPLETDDTLTAPNRFIVVSNAAIDPNQPVVGRADVPVNAPNSVVNRGFAIPAVLDLQISNSDQAQAVAEGLANRNTIYERISLDTVFDPRYDGYNVVRWQGVNWLELSRNVPLVPGEPMSHEFRKSYGAA